MSWSAAASATGRAHADIELRTAVGAIERPCMHYWERCNGLGQMVLRSHNSISDSFLVLRHEAAPLACPALAI